MVQLLSVLLKKDSVKLSRPPAAPITETIDIRRAISFAVIKLSLRLVVTLTFNEAYYIHAPTESLINAAKLPLALNRGDRSKAPIRNQPRKKPSAIEYQ